MRDTEKQGEGTRTRDGDGDGAGARGGVTVGSSASSYGYLALAATCIAFAPIFVKFLDGMGPTPIGAYRTGMGAFLLFGILGWERLRRPGARSESNVRPEPNVRTAPPETSPAMSVRQLSSSSSEAKLYFWIIVAGVLFSIDLYVWHRSVHWVGAGVGTILGNTQVFYLALVGLLFFKEKLNWRYAISVPLAFAGIALLVLVDQSAMPTPNYWWGVACGLATGVAYASYMLVLRHLQSLTQRGPTFILALICTVAAVVLGITAGLEGTMRWPTPTEWWPILGVGLLPQVIGWILISRHLPRVDVSRSGLILLLQPTLATLLGALLFAEHLSGKQLIGAGLTLFAVYLGSTRTSTRRAKSKK